MKKLNHILIASCLILFGACSAEENSPEMRERDRTAGKVHFRAELPDPLITRTTLGDADNGHHKVSWEEGDKVRIVFGSGADDYVDALVGTDGDIEAEVPEAEAYYAVYPVCETALDGDGFSFVLPVEQSGEFAAAGFLTAVATEQDRVFNFANASGLLKFEVKRSGLVRAAIRACDGTPLAGTSDKGIDSVSVTLNGPGTYYAAVLRDADMKAGLAFRFYEEDGALPGVLSLSAIKAGAGELWDLGAPDSRIYEGDYYITPDGSGDGKSADAPAGPALLHRLLSTRLSSGLSADGVAHAWRVSGKTIHLLPGEYWFDEESGIVSALAKCSPVRIEGAGEVVVTSEGASAFSLGGEASFSFRGITFKGSTTPGNGAAINWSSTGRLQLADCVFEGNTAALSGGALYASAGTVDVSGCSFVANKAAAGIAYSAAGGLASGGAVYAVCPAEAVGETLLRMYRCGFSDNESGTYGCHLSIYTASGEFNCTAYADACSFKDGYADNGGAAKASGGERYYGKSIHSDALKEAGVSVLAVNNSTVAGLRETPAKDAKYNGMSLVSGENTVMMALNSTFFGASNGTIFKNLYRNGSESRVDEVYLMNCLLTNMTNTASVAKTSINLYSGTPVVKAAFNLFDESKNGYSGTGDTSGIRYDQITWTWNDTDLLYEWSTTSAVTSYATAAAVEEFALENMPGFDAWLKTNSPAPYSADQAGHSRNPLKLNKGAWDTGL